LLHFSHPPSHHFFLLCLQFDSKCDWPRNFVGQTQTPSIVKQNFKKHVV